MSDSGQPHRQQPTRLPHPWDSPGKTTGVGCHFLLQCMKVKSEGVVSQLCPTLSNPMYCSLPGSSVHGIFQARVLEWGAIAISICCGVVAKSFQPLCKLMDCGPPGSSIHGISKPPPPIKSQVWGKNTWAEASEDTGMGGP